MKQLSLFLICASIAFSQVADEANRTYKTKEGRDAVARGLADPQRDEKQKPRELVEAMALKPGQAVADVGTGVGFMLPYLSVAVGPTGHVTGEDIAPDFLEKARLRVRTGNLKNVTLVAGTDQDPKLPADTLNAVLVLDTYHHFDYPQTMLGAIRDSLLSEGRLFIVDYYKSENAMPGGRALTHIRLDRDDVASEIEASGFRLVGKSDHIPGSQYILTFQKK